MSIEPILRPRARDLLKAYYGTTPIIKPTQSPIDLNSDCYDNSKFLSILVKDIHLVDLIKKDNELITEIKEIDGNMQTLVYENYNQFIAASDTIKLVIYKSTFNNE